MAPAYFGFVLRSTPHQCAALKEQYSMPIFFFAYINRSERYSDFQFLLSSACYSNIQRYLLLDLLTTVIPEFVCRPTWVNNQFNSFIGVEHSFKLEMWYLEKPDMLLFSFSTCEVNLKQRQCAQTIHMSASYLRKFRRSKVGLADMFMFTKFYLKVLLLLAYACLWMLRLACWLWCSCKSTLKPSLKDMLHFVKHTVADVETLSRAEYPAVGEPIQALRLPR